jgi:hypothetical protein
MHLYILYIFSQQVYRKNNGLGIDSVTIYLIGDYNFNIASPYINNYFSTNPIFPGHNSTGKNLFINPHLSREISSMYKLTTTTGEGYSLEDNAGTRSPCNIDCILKIDLKSG